MFFTQLLFNFKGINSMVSVGQELLNVPFGDMIREIALAIAEGQIALDIN